MDSRKKSHSLPWCERISTLDNVSEHKLAGEGLISFRGKDNFQAERLGY